MRFVLPPAILAAAAAHARAAYPQESCGLVVGETYEPCENVAADPLKDFAIDDAVIERAEARGLIAVVHSHPEGPLCPSAKDMLSQAGCDLPWIILPVFKDPHGADLDVLEPIVFGDCLGMAPILARVFVHGVHDCYATIRDSFRKGKAALAAETPDNPILWPHDPIDVPDFPRDLNWWEDERFDLYRDGFATAGFREIASSEAQPGDVFLAITPGTANPLKRLNHGGVLLAGNLFLHHLPGRLSRREPAGNWLRAVHLWLRHESVLDA